MHTTPVNAAGNPRAAVTMPGYHAGRSLRNKGRRYLADPPTVEEIIAVMRAAGGDQDGDRLRALTVVLWRAGLRISEALALTETDLDLAEGRFLSATARETNGVRLAWTAGDGNSSNRGENSELGSRLARSSA